MPSTKVGFLMFAFALSNCSNGATADEFNSQSPDRTGAQMYPPAAQQGQNNYAPQQPVTRSGYRARTAPMPVVHHNYGTPNPQTSGSPAPREAAPESVTIDQARTQDLSLPDESNGQPSPKNHGGGLKNLVRRGINRHW